MYDVLDRLRDNLTKSIDDEEWKKLLKNSIYDGECSIGPLTKKLLTVTRQQMKRMGNG